MNTYVSGKESDKIVVILTDIYGNKYNNVLWVADQFAKAGYYTLIPDILKGDDCEFGKTDLAKWLPNHGSEVTRPVVESFLEKLTNSIDTKFIGLVGYCFGAKYVIQQLTESTKVTVGAVAHPSFVTIDEVAEISKPILISAAETDGIFTEELRKQTEEKLKENKARYQIDLFSGVSHGFAVRGDPKDPVVTYAQEKALFDQIHWFNTFSAWIWGFELILD